MSSFPDRPSRPASRSGNPELVMFKSGSDRGTAIEHAIGIDDHVAAQNFRKLLDVDAAKFGPRRHYQRHIGTSTGRNRIDASSERRMPLAARHDNGVEHLHTERLQGF